jgi:hypothetical protein
MAIGIFCVADLAANAAGELGNATRLRTPPARDAATIHGNVERLEELLNPLMHFCRVPEA